MSLNISLVIRNEPIKSTRRICINSTSEISSMFLNQIFFPNGKRALVIRISTLLLPFEIFSRYNDSRFVVWIL